MVIYIISPLSSAPPEMSRIGQCRMSALTPDMAAFCTSAGETAGDLHSDKESVSEKLLQQCNRMWLV